MATTTAPVTAAPEATKISLMTQIQNHFNKYVDWTSRGLHFVSVNKLSLQMDKVGETEADCTLKKVGKVFAMLLASVVTAPFALVGHGVQAIKNFLFKAKVEENATNKSEVKADDVEKKDN